MTVTSESNLLDEHHKVVRQGKDRLIRFEDLNDPERPGLLSHYDTSKNLIRIDRERAELMAPIVLNQLMFTEMEYTRIGPGGLTFIPYHSTTTHG